MGEITAEHVRMAAQRLEVQRQLGEAWLRWRLCPRRQILERAECSRAFWSLARQALAMYR